MNNFIAKSEPECIEYMLFNHSPRSLWLERNQALRDVHESKADIAICITLYNESYQYLKETLVSNYLLGVINLASMKSRERRRAESIERVSFASEAEPGIL